MSVLILDISLTNYFLLQYVLLHHFKNCSMKSWLSWVYCQCTCFRTVQFISAWASMEDLRHSKGRVLWPSGDFALWISLTTCSSVPLVASVTKLYQPRSDSIISYVIDLINSQSSQPYSLQFNLSWQHFSISLLNPWTYIMMNSYWNSW